MVYDIEFYAYLPKMWIHFFLHFDLRSDPDPHFFSAGSGSVKKNVGLSSMSISLRLRLAGRYLSFSLYFSLSSSIFVSVSLLHTHALTFFRSSDLKRVLEDFYSRFLSSLTSAVYRNTPYLGLLHSWAWSCAAVGLLPRLPDRGTRGE